MSSPPLGKILVIDDETGPRESLRILLKNDYKVFLAESVDRGIELLRSESPDLVIMDIRMPGKSGIEGLREIRALDRVVSVIMLTGYGALETAQEAIRLGATDYLKKPFDTTGIMKVIGRNVERTRIERRRHAAARELQVLNTRLMEDMAEKDRMAALGQASAEFAHDFRNPLTVVMGYVDLLSDQLEELRRESGSESEALEHLVIIEENVRRCYDLAQMWQRFARGEDEQLQPMALDGLLRDCVSAAEPMAAVAGVELGLDVEPGNEWTAMISEGSLKRAVHNVLVNAIQAMPEGGGRLRVRLRGGRPGEARIEAIDNGCGMAPEQLDRIFEAYYTTKEKKQGAGLGLSITRKIVENHGGSISARSEPGRGTVMTITLPVVPEGALPRTPAAAVDP